MFYINRQLLKRREVFFLRVLPTIVVLSAFVGLTIASWITAKNNLYQEQRRLLSEYNTATASQIRQRLDTYQDILRGAAGLFNASDHVTHTEWNSYFKAYDITANYPGIQSVGYIQLVPYSSLKSFEATMRQTSGVPGYTVHPSGVRDVYAPVAFLEPFNATSTVYGFDTYTSDSRRTTLMESGDTNQVVMSDLLTLVNDISKPEIERQPGFIMYAPIYRNGRPLDTVEQRQAHVMGYIYSPFRTYDLLNKIVLNQNPSYGFAIENITNAGRETVFQSDNYTSLGEVANSARVSTIIELPGATWEISGVASSGLVSRPFRLRPPSVLWGGLVFSLMVAAFIYMLLTSRARALVEKEERNIQEAKDELLALASHQLRTPATGVKQYIGMLREGFAGKLTPLQLSLLDKAYASNERQLGTINDMLFVARADAGHLQMKAEQVELQTLIREAVDEQKQAITARRQKIIVDLTKKPITILASRQYVCMIVENLISNATKYTPPKGSITVTLRRKGDRAVLKVKDTGVGVAIKDKQLLFQKFSRIPNELTDEVVGSGIGLYLSKKLVEAHHGTISFDSSPGKGSTVTVTLPMNQSSESHPDPRLKHP